MYDDFYPNGHTLVTILSPNGCILFAQVCRSRGISEVVVSEEWTAESSLATITEFDGDCEMTAVHTSHNGSAWECAA